MIADDYCSTPLFAIAADIIAGRLILTLILLILLILLLSCCCSITMKCLHDKV